MRVLGIDCGTERTGWGVIDSDGRRHTVVGHGVIRTQASRPLAERLSSIGREVRALIAAHALDAAAVEDVFFSRNVKSALKLAHVRGVVLAALADAGVVLGEYTPLEVKTSVVGYGRAEKSQVQLMVRTLTGLEGVIETEDASDALAVAICHATTCARTLPAPRARKLAGTGR